MEWTKMPRFFDRNRDAIPPFFPHFFPLQLFYHVKRRAPSRSIQEGCLGSESVSDNEGNRSVPFALKGSKQLFRLYTSRSAFPFSQSPSLQRSTNTSSTFVSSHYKVGFFIGTKRRSMRTRSWIIFSERDVSIRRMRRNTLCENVCFVPSHITTRRITCTNCLELFLLSSVDISVRKRGLSFVIVVVPVARGSTSKECREIFRMTRHLR